MSVADLRRVSPTIEVYSGGALDDQWEANWPVNGPSSFFQSAAWLRCFEREVAAGEPLRIWETKTVAGAVPTRTVLPLYLRSRWTCLGRYRSLEFPLNYWGTRYGPLGDLSVDSLAALLQAAIAHDQNWDELRLDWLAKDTAALLAEAMGRGGLAYLWETADSAYQIDLSPGWEAYWHSRSSKHRNNIRRADKALARAGRVEWIHHRAQRAARWDLYDECVRLAEQSWQGGARRSTSLNHPRVRNFLRHMHAEAGETGHVEMHLLRVDDRTVAYAYNYLWRDEVFGLRRGHDPRWARLSPGTALLHRMLRVDCEAGVRLFHLGEGVEDYKRRWATGQVQSFRLRHFAPNSWRGRAASVWFRRRAQRCHPT